MSDENQAKRCVKFFKIGNKIGTLDGLRKRLFHQKLYRKAIMNYVNSNFNEKMMDQIFSVKSEMEFCNTPDLDNLQEKLIDIYEQLLVETMDLADHLMKEETK